MKIRKKSGLLPNPPWTPLICAPFPKTVMMMMSSQVLPKNYKVGKSAWWFNLLQLNDNDDNDDDASIVKMIK